MTSTNRISTSKRPHVDTFLVEGCRQLNINPKIQWDASRLLERASLHDTRIQGMCLRGRAAAAVYVASIINGEPRTQKEIHGAFSVTEVTVRNVYKRILPVLSAEELVVMQQHRSIKVPVEIGG